MPRPAPRANDQPAASPAGRDGAAPAGAETPQRRGSRARAAGPAEVVLGIDPGLNRTGYCLLARGASGPVLREAGVIRSTRGGSLAGRVVEIGQGLRDVCRQYQPAVMAIEQVFTAGRFPKSSLLMAHARGALLFAAAEQGVPVVHYSARQIKRLLTGSGKADKAQVQRAVARELGLARVPEPHDVADAAAAALCHYYAARTSLLIDRSA